MAELWKHLSNEAQKRVVDAIESGVLKVQSYVSEEGYKTFTPKVGMDDYDEVSESLCRAVHTVLMSDARPVSGLPKPYTHVGTGFIAAILDEVVREALSTKRKGRLAGFIAERLAVNGLARKTTRHAKTWYLRKWPRGFKFRAMSAKLDSLTTRDEARLQRRIKEEGGKPVTSEFDPTIIPVPDPSRDGLDALVKYVADLVECFKRERKYHKQIVAELREELETAKGALDHRSEKLEEATATIVDLVASIGEENDNGNDAG